MKKDIKSILDKLEKIEENHLGQLNGGFASPFISIEIGPVQATSNNCKHGVCGPSTNNCHAGNCSTSCGIIKG